MWKQVLSALLCIVKEYFQSSLKGKLQEAIRKASEAFFRILWDNLKEEVTRVTTEVIKNANDYLRSEGVLAKKEELINKVIKNVKFPLILRPFKGLIKKKILNKVDEVVSNILQKSLDLIV